MSALEADDRALPRCTTLTSTVSSGFLEGANESFAHEKRPPDKKCRLLTEGLHMGSLGPASTQLPGAEVLGTGVLGTVSPTLPCDGKSAIRPWCIGRGIKHGVLEGALRTVPRVFPGCILHCKRG